MISPETLRRYPFFGLLDTKQLANIAMLTDTIEYEDGATIFEQKDQAQKLYFLLEGCIDLYYTVVEAYLPSDRREALVCEINPGELFGISSLIPPHEMTATARSSGRSRVMQIDAAQLTRMFEEDRELEVLLMRRVAQAAMLRLHATRVQLAAAWK